MSEHVHNMYKEIWITACVDDDIEYSFDRKKTIKYIFFNYYSESEHI